MIESMAELITLQHKPQKRTEGGGVVCLSGVFGFVNVTKYDLKSEFRLAILNCGSHTLSQAPWLDRI